jgi:hypothetical protein
MRGMKRLKGSGCSRIRERGFGSAIMFSLEG